MKLFKLALTSGWVVLACIVLVSMAVPQGVRPYLSGISQVLLPIWALVTAVYIAGRFYFPAPQTRRVHESRDSAGST
jgi:hypothetical protein